MIAAVFILLATGQVSDSGIDGGASADPDGGAAETVEVQGFQIPIAADSSTPGHRPVEGVVDDALTIRPPKVESFNYDDFLEAHTVDLSSCASWSSDGRAVRGWLSVEWVVAADGTASQFRVLTSELDSPLVERCMLREMGNWHFPPPPSELTVRHNFYLSLPPRTDLPPIGGQ